MVVSVTSILQISKANVTRVNPSKDGQKLYVNLTDGVSEFSLTAPAALRSALEDALLVPRKLTMQVEGALYSSSDNNGDRQVLRLVAFNSEALAAAK